MEVQNNQDHNSPTNNSAERNTEPVRSRWTPKPEQIVILESIFNSGMVNPPKDETVRIRKMLEKFGAVGDANVFYWFQNRRSRSRRRQRQLQASLAGEQRNNLQASSGGAIQYENSRAALGMGLGFGTTTTSPSFANSNPISTNFFLGSSSSSNNNCGGGVIVDDGVIVDHLFTTSGQMGFHEIDQTSSTVSSILCPSETSNLQYQSGFITVFINGVQTEVPREAVDMKAVFGQDVILVHSSGVAVPTNEFGYLIQSLQHGESYFLVSRTA